MKIEDASDESTQTHVNMFFSMIVLKWGLYSLRSSSLKDTPRHIPSRDKIKVIKSYRTLKSSESACRGHRKINCYFFTQKMSFHFILMLFNMTIRYLITLATL